MEDFSFAMAILQGIDISTKIQSPTKLRDPVLKHVLSLFDEKPVDIFQVGAIESLDSKFRIGSGWSDTVFGPHVKKFGGSLVIVDVNLDHLANSYMIADAAGYPVDLKLGDAIDHISEGCNIYYLDGADGHLGDIQTLEQFKKIEHTSSVVLIDDIQTKAVSLVSYLRSKKIKYDIHDVGNGGMITVDIRKDK
jgi:hypothetical protein|tara:strand:+ start:2889 stop:3467 length:579 start_codon:yes stop_codon:yes gene_type:complete